LEDSWRGGKTLLTKKREKTRLSNSGGREIRPSNSPGGKGVNET